MIDHAVNTGVVPAVNSSPDSVLDFNSAHALSFRFRRPFRSIDPAIDFNSNYTFDHDNVVPSSRSTTTTWSRHHSRRRQRGHVIAVDYDPTPAPEPGTIPFLIPISIAMPISSLSGLSYIRIVPTLRYGWQRRRRPSTGTRIQDSNRQLNWGEDLEKTKTQCPHEEMRERSLLNEKIKVTGWIFQKKNKKQQHARGFNPHSSPRCALGSDRRHRVYTCRRRLPSDKCVAFEPAGTGLDSERGRVDRAFNLGQIIPRGPCHTEHIKSSVADALIGLSGVISGPQLAPSLNIHCWTYASLFPKLLRHSPGPPGGQRGANKRVARDPESASLPRGRWWSLIMEEA
ncbi:hypothetical protein EVAR_48730_1 [Eumeta japonica]|uniref:Uncharacterized protein n=1 Tax=Eumeta variegata TaxID=151549 RepID=A0A4C1YJ28_EUMVA|nr:hypothetical protein EVAR_48730_1 [Eumeta japonica]